MNIFLVRFFSISLITLTFVFCSSCNNKNQAAQDLQNNKTTKDGITTIQQPNITSASVKANDAESGNSSMEKFATKEAKDPIAFDVRGDKLELIVNDSQHRISFGTPRTYETISYTVLSPSDISRKFTEFSSREITVTPIHAFGSKQNSLVVSLIKFTTNQTLEQYIDKYEALNKQRFASATFTTTAFKNRDIPMTQFFIQEAESGLFRIIFPASQKNQLLQFDYTIRRNSIQADIERIEPSIGSIGRISAIQ
jgi:hypothetical protein